MKKKQDGRWQDYLPKSRNGSDARKRKRRRRIIVLLVVLLLIGVLAGSVIRFRGFGLFKKKTPAELVRVTLESVYDGDTIRVKMPDGTEETVRMLLIDAPESVHPDETKNTEEGRRAAKFLSELLSKHQTLYLEYEDPENNRDLYGRLLAYVWLKGSTSVEQSYIKENMVNAIILSNGHAAFHVYQNGNPVKEEYRRVLEGLQ